MSRRILLLYNTPKARRYFHVLRDNIPDLDIQTRAIGLAGGSNLEASRYQLMTAYTMARKHARYRIPQWRIDKLQAVHEKFAHWHYHDVAAKIRRLKPDAIGVWGGQSVDTRAALAAADDWNVPHYTFECGLLPATTTCDPRGVNFESSVPRNSIFYANYPWRNEMPLPDTLLLRANRHADAAISLPDDYIFIPFQVRLDSQVLLYSPWIRDMRHLFEVVVEAARQALGDRDTCLVFKLHPSCKERYPELQQLQHSNSKILFANGNATDTLIRGARGVITINSTVGIEALLLNRPVLSLGRACYDIPGVTECANHVNQISQWMLELQQNILPIAKHRAAFLQYLHRDYCIPGHHKSPSEEHFRVLAQRLAHHPYDTRVSNHADVQLVSA